MNQPCVYLSYVQADQSWAERLAARLDRLGLSLGNRPSAPAATEAFAPRWREALLASTHTLVLIGPTTRFSRWVDREIELSTERREEGPGAGLIGVILESHADFRRPYYDPENVPIRLHDLVENEYGIVRKWSEEPEDLTRWLAEAERRRQSARPCPSLRAAREIYRFGWDQGVDAARPDLEAP